ncbi:MAG: hypothetical protein OEV80_15415, partial [candidate division Zixibacteria bacterium]|nr:hypothetical protein [candidate division Zixibacteria bacterium]
PLMAYPWKPHADRLILWAKGKSETHCAFAFDFLMSLAYVDTISDIQRHFKVYEGLPAPYSMHFGFINLCAPLFIEKGAWFYQKAAKPQSGAIGKLTSEIVLRFIELVFPNLTRVRAVGGVGSADAVLRHADGRTILCEVKASPLTTFPFLLSSPTRQSDATPNKLTRTQIQDLDSALYMHCQELIPLGRPKDDLWPFCSAVNFIVEECNRSKVDLFVETWQQIREAYIKRDRGSKYYYVANASGHPPKNAKEDFDWPARESVSDSKTSAGMDRTDDIKKGIYQTFKLSVDANRRFAKYGIKTALISNLPAYRHGEDYVEPFYDIYWGYEASFVKEKSGHYKCQEDDLKRPFDYIIALEDAFLRNDLV